MKTLLERVAQGEILISDGAMGTFLHAKGLARRRVSGVLVRFARGYRARHRGCLRGCRCGYRRNQLVRRQFLQAEGIRASRQAVAFNRAAASLAKEAVAGRGYVAASVGPTGQMVEEEGGEVTAAQLYESFKEQVIALAEGGADAICVETMWSVHEAAQAIRAAKENTQLPVICTFTFEPGKRGFRTTMGVTPERAVRAALDAGADMVGANCGNGIVT